MSRTWRPWMVPLPTTIGSMKWKSPIWRSPPGSRMTWWLSVGIGWQRVLDDEWRCGWSWHLITVILLVTLEFLQFIELVELVDKSSSLFRCYISCVNLSLNLNQLVVNYALTPQLIPTRLSMFSWCFGSNSGGRSSSCRWDCLICSVYLLFFLSELASTLIRFAGGAPF